MGKLGFAGALSHAPGMAAFRAAAPAAQRDAFLHAAGELRAHLERAKLDALVVIAPDHFSNFFVDNMPACCVALNERYRGPVEDWLGIDRLEIAGAHGLAKDILAHAYQRGIEPAFAADAQLEHGVMVPLSLLTPHYSLPIVWVMLNCQVPPLMSLRRCYELGRSIRNAIDGSGLNVGVVGTGGLSHSPGGPDADRLDEDFDRAFLNLLDRNAVDEILSLSDQRIDAAGFGAWEIRLWIAALGAAHDRKPRTLAYEAVHAWETGCAVAVFE